MLKLSYVNKLLGLFIILINLYNIALPFSPTATFWVEQQTSYAAFSLNMQVTTDTKSIPKDNRIVIPRLLMDEPIYDDASAQALDKGIWRRPKSSIPAAGSNTVLSGHRFTYKGQTVFYHLDLIKPGDRMVVYWGGEKFVYKVAETKVAGPDDVSVEAPTQSPKLTLYTSTPLWTAKDRLVIVAERIKP